MGTPSLDDLPGVLPHSSLHARLYAMARVARSSASGLAFFGIMPGIGLATTLLILPIFIIGLTGSLSNPAAMPFPGMEEVYFLVAWLAGLCLGSVGGYFLLRLLLMQRFNHSFDATLTALSTTSLAQLVADEDFCACFIASARERWSNLFAAPPVCRNLEEQLGLEASYIRLLSTYQFSLANERSVIWRHGNIGYFSITPAARVINAIGSFGGCVPYIGCFGYLLMPFAIRNLLRFAEQRGALCAICAYFSDPRAADWLREVAPATSTPA